MVKPSELSAGTLVLVTFHAVVTRQMVNGAYVEIHEGGLWTFVSDEDDAVDSIRILDGQGVTHGGGHDRDDRT